MNALEQFQNKMREKGIDYYYLCMGDDHNSEFIHPFYKTIEYLTGFTGSAGQLVIERDHVILWSDGRYYIQAKKQIEGKSIEFYDLTMPSPIEYIQSRYSKNQVIAFDGRIVNYKTGLALQKIGRVKSEEYIIDEIWNDRPGLGKDKIFILEQKYCGVSLQEKIQIVRDLMKQNHTSYFLLETLDDIAWLLNLRGYDVISNPVFLSFLLISEKEITLYIDLDKCDKDVCDYLKENDIQLQEYSKVYEDVKNIQDSIWMDPSNISYNFVACCKGTIHFEVNPTEILKAIKNNIEIENLRQCHLMDSVALTKFIYWLKKNVGTMDLDEYNVSLYLKELRKQIPGYIEVNYGCISAYNENAAMMHYQATEQMHSKLKAEGLYLVDSGGQYKTGTTDYTRTIALGDVCEEWKKDFTTVLISHAHLANAVFLEGCSGMNLDVLAREPIWKRYLDYQCGTGHGLGFCLGVHEGPHGLRWYKSEKRKEDTPLQAGMIVTNEPGIYIENSHGIRIENDMLVIEKVKNHYGQFLGFETLNFVPIDLECIIPSLLDKETKQWLNEYHTLTYQKLSPYLTREEAQWLKENTVEVE